MRPEYKWRALIILVAILLAAFFILPSVTDSLPKWWSGNVEPIKLGLDLRGGMHLVLEVEAEKAVESTVERIASDLKEKVRKEKVYCRKVDRFESQKMEIVLIKADQEDRLNRILDRDYPDLRRISSEPVKRGLRIIFGLTEKEIDRIKRSAVDQALETIRNRIDELGLSEPEIVPQGEDRILIQLPGIKDPQRAINLIGKTAILEFKLVDEEHSLDEALKGKVPEGTQLLYQVEKDRETNRVRKTPMLLKKKTLLTGDVIKDARVSFNRFGEAYISMNFDSQGAKLFERITAANVKKRLAIILDKNVYSAPVIQERISGGRAQITGRFTDDEAHDLAIVLRAGSLPAPVKILEQRTVGPSLGHDSIQAGLLSMAVGGIAVVIFIAVYYNLSGLIANVALILNILFIMGALAGFRATLTLPGIAGIILTIGMAVDANVLIFERIREELRIGMTPSAAIDGGYSKAFLTIIDANLTTLIAAVVLFQFGTGPIKGFAVTLSIGILASLFTAIIVSRLIFEYLLVKRKLKTLSI
jgi:preprotein translocase subunit SecD